MPTIAATMHGFISNLKGIKSMLQCIYPLISDITIPPFTDTTAGAGGENSGEWTYPIHVINCILL